MSLVLGGLGWLLPKAFPAGLFAIGAPGRSASPPRSTSTTAPTSTPIDPRNAIVRENALPGTAAWQIPNDRAAIVEIQGYAGA